MLKIKQCGILFLFVFILPAYAQNSDAFDLERITITKAKVHLLTPYSLAADDLDNLPYPCAVESLGSMPLDLQSRSPKDAIQTDFSLRGSTFQGVLVLLNGQRINDPQTAHHNSDIPLTKEDIEEIQVIPGAGSSLFGPDAIGGAVNFLVKKPQTRKLVLETGFGPDKNKSQLFSYSDKINNFGMRVSVENKESGGFYYDTDYRKFTTSLASNLDLPCGDFGLNFGYQDKEFGAYDFYTPAKGYPSREWTTTYLIDTGFNINKEGLKIKPNFLWRRHFDKFMLDETNVKSRSLNHHRSDIFTPNIYFQKDLEKLGTLGLGVEYGEENIASSNLGKHNRKHKSVFIDDSKDLTDNLSLGLSFRFDKFDTFGNTDTGSGTLRYSLCAGNSVYAGVSFSRRIPSFTELYYNDSTTIGDDKLSAEKAVNYQIGFDHKDDVLSYGASVFFREEENVIDWVKRTTSQVKWQVENITEAAVTGIEKYFKVKINDFINLTSNYTFINKRINDQGYLYKYGPNYIRHMVNSVFTFKLPFGAQAITLSYKKKPVRDGWFLLGVNLTYDLNKNSNLFFRATNIFNQEYQEIEGIPQPGRVFEAGIRLAW